MIHKCPRCGGASLESFKTHVYCSSCNYDGGESVRSSTNTNDWLRLLVELESISSEGSPVQKVKKSNLNKFATSMEVSA